MKTAVYDNGEGEEKGRKREKDKQAPVEYKE
jgi:hypothetical protein